MSRRLTSFAATLFMALTFAEASFCAETDQYMTWGIELEDSADALDAYINEQAAVFLERANRRKKPVDSCEELTSEFYLYLFQGLHASRIRKWLQSSEEVDRYPDKSLSFFQYQRASIYKGLAFPYILPMARTVRVGDVYLGIDKIGHFFGFGRRYFQRYLRLRDAGADEHEAVERTVRVGIAHESSIVGRLSDGVFSHGDMEANYQGLVMARDCCEGENPYFRQDEGDWILVRPFDMRRYITPDFDESYNNSHYWGTRKKKTLRYLEEHYAGMENSEAALERLARYAQYEPSLSKQIVADYYAERGHDPQKEQSLSALSAKRFNQIVEAGNGSH